MTPFHLCRGHALSIFVEITVNYLKLFVELLVLQSFTVRSELLLALETNVARFAEELSVRVFAFFSLLGGLIGPHCLPLDQLPVLLVNRHDASILLLPDEVPIDLLKFVHLLAL